MLTEKGKSSRRHSIFGGGGRYQKEKTSTGWRFKLRVNFGAHEIVLRNLYFKCNESNERFFEGQE